jgi:hypothetical protein
LSSNSLRSQRTWIGTAAALDEALEEAIHRIADRVDFRVDAHEVALCDAGLAYRQRARK